MSDEVHFCMPGYVNKQNGHYWAPNNPPELHQCPLYNAKVTGWCAISPHGIIGPYFFENVEGHTLSVNAKRYKVMLETLLQNELHCHQLDSNKMQQLFTQPRFPCKSSAQRFQADSFLIPGTSAGMPDHLILQYQTTSLGLCPKQGIQNTSW
jgi:hypothetical protein